MIDLIIPTVKGREEWLERCISSYTAHGEVNPIVIEDSLTCGWGWKTGLDRSEAPYVLLACDDQECVGSLEVAIQTVNEGFLPCPRVWNADGSIQSQGGDMNVRHHIISRPQKDRTPVDYTTVPLMSREQADVIGMIPTHYSSDVWVSYRGRQLGYETVLRHGYEIVHHLADVKRGAGMSQYERAIVDEESMREELERCAV